MLGSATGLGLSKARSSGENRRPGKVGLTGSPGEIVVPGTWSRCCACRLRKIAGGEDRISNHAEGRKWGPSDVGQDCNAGLLTSVSAHGGALPQGPVLATALPGGSVVTRRKRARRKARKAADQAHHLPQLAAITTLATTKLLPSGLSGCSRSRIGGRAIRRNEVPARSPRDARRKLRSGSWSCTKRSGLTGLGQQTKGVFGWKMY